MTDDCTLCGLSTPPEPVTAPDTSGSFCCRGCLEVARTIGDVEDASASAIIERAGTDEDEGSAEAVAENHAEAFLEIDGMHCTTCEAFVALRGGPARGSAPWMRATRPTPHASATTPNG